MGNIENIENAQTSAIDAASGFWAQAAESQASAAIQAAGISASAYKKAAGIMSEAYDKGIAYQKEMYAEARNNNDNWIKAGKWAVSELKSKMQEFDGSPESYEESPYFDWLQTETINALDKSASSRGKLESGAQQKAVMEYGKNMASTDYDSWLNRYYQSLTPYQTMAEQGRAAAATLTAAGNSTANAVSNLYGQQGQAVGSGITNAANATAAGTLGAASANSNYLNQMGNAMIDAGDIRASSYVNQMNQDNANTNSLYQLGGMVLPSAIEAAPKVYNAASEYYSGYTPTQQNTNNAWVNPDTGNTTW